MSESNRNTTSGVLIQPRWKRAPSGAERILAMMMTVLPLLGLAAGTFIVGLVPPQMVQAAQKMENSVKSMRSSLSAERTDGTLAARAEPTRYAKGREAMARFSVQPAVTLLADRKHGQTAAWIMAAFCGAFGLLFCFLGWQIRRATAALYGGFTFGLVAFTVALGAQMGIVPSALVALPPAFLGALIGWHMIVVITCLQVGALLCLPTMMVLVLLTGVGETPYWVIPTTLSVWALVTALTYLFLVRAVLISGWAVGGAASLATGAVTALYAWKSAIMPWEATMAIIAIFAIAGTLTQYRFAGGAATDDAGGGDDEDAGARKARPKLKPA